MYLALLSYRATPLPWCSLSPSNLLMGRVIRTDVPQDVNKFKPEWSYLTMYQEKEKRYRQDQKQIYDRHHRTRTLPNLPDTTPVWVSTPQGQVPGYIVSAVPEPRSYHVRCSSKVTSHSLAPYTLATQILDTLNPITLERLSRDKTLEGLLT